MKDSVRIAIVGDFNEEWAHHRMIGESLLHAASKVGVQLKSEWIPTDGLSGNHTSVLDAYDGIWCSSGSPYRSMDGAMAAITFARERQRAFFAT